MDFFIEFFIVGVIIGVLFLVLRLKDLKTNADSLKNQTTLLTNQLNEEKALANVRESKLHRTILGLQDALSEEQQVIKTKEAELKKQESALLEDIAQVTKTLEAETENRKKVASQKKSSEVRLGNIAEKLAPFLEDFTFNPEDATFLGKPIDYIVFEDEVITFVEIKMGKSQLSTKQRHIRNLIQEKQVAWKEIRIK